MMPDRRAHTAMSPTQRLRVWALGALAFLVLVYLLRGVLLPFVAGMAIAYFLDPLAERLERMGVSRIMATTLITLVFFVVFGMALFLLVPILEQQVVTFIERVPSYVQALNERAKPLVEELHRRLSPGDIEKLQSSIGAYAGTVVGWAVSLVRGVLTGGIAIMSILSLLFITPVVTFYLLRDWHKVVNSVDGWLPRHHAGTIRSELREIERQLSLAQGSPPP